MGGWVVGEFLVVWIFFEGKTKRRFSGRLVEF